jgi:hypothetical protein
MKEYYFWQIATALIVLYFVSWFLMNKGKISLIWHRRIWNIMLLASFLVVGVSGIFLALRLNYGISLGEYDDMLFNHVELGIVMTIIAIFHILWHLAYFKSIFKKNINTNCD